MIQLSPLWSWGGRILLGASALLVIVPLLLVVSASFKPPHEIYTGGLLPSAPTLDNYAEVFRTLPFGIYLWNSVGTTFLRVAGQLVIGILAAYAFVRFEFRLKGLLFALVLLALMIPHQLTFLPVYLMISKFNWFDTWLALIIPNLATPFAVFLLRQYLMSFPKELIDAAEMDGAGELRILWSIVLPNLKPAIAALVIILFVDCWNEYFWPLVVTETDRAITAQIGIRRFLDSEQGDRLGPLMAAVVMVSLPAIVLFAFCQRQIVQTLVSSGIKG